MLGLDNDYDQNMFLQHPLPKLSTFFKNSIITEINLEEVVVCQEAFLCFPFYFCCYLYCYLFVGGYCYSKKSHMKEGSWRTFQEIYNA